MSDISNSSIRDPYWLRGFYLGFGAFIVLSGVFMMAVGYFAEPRLWIVVLCGLVLVSFSVLAGRAAANGVSFEGDRVTVRTGFRTRSFERSEVAGFFSAPGFGSRSRLGVRLHSGEEVEIAVDLLAARSTDFHEVVQQCRSWLRQKTT